MFKNLILFSIVTIPICILTNSAEGSPFSTSSIIFVVPCLFNNCSKGVRWYLIMVLSCISLMMFSIFSCAIWPLVLCLFFKSVFVFLHLSCMLFIPNLLRVFLSLRDIVKCFYLHQLGWLYNFIHSIIFIDLLMLNHPCILVINTEWSWCIMFLLCCWIYFALR